MPLTGKAARAGVGVGDIRAVVTVRGRAREVDDPSRAVAARRRPGAARRRLTEPVDGPPGEHRYSVRCRRRRSRRACQSTPRTSSSSRRSKGRRRKKKTGKGRIIAIVVSVAVIAGVFAFALPKIANYGDVWDVVKGLSWEWIVALVLAVLLNTATYGPPWMAALPGLPYLHATRVTLASTAMSTVAPGGAAVGMATSFAMLRAWGFRGRPVGLAVVVTGVWNQLVILGIPIIALAGVAAEGGSNRTLELVALIALGIFIAIVVGFAVGLSSARLARRVGDRAAADDQLGEGADRQGAGEVEGRVVRAFPRGDDRPDPRALGIPHVRHPRRAT